MKFCLACGTRLAQVATDAYCSTLCAEHGPPRCQGCNEPFYRRADEPVGNFRKRKYCGTECLTKYKAELKTLAWRDPLLRSRMIRGLQISQNSPEQVLRARTQMQQNWKDGEFRALLEQRHRIFTADEIRAIRADPRSNTIVGEDYGVTGHLIARIRRRFVYRNID